MKKLIKIQSIIMLLLFILISCKDEPTKESTVKPWVGKWNTIQYTDSTGTKYPWIGIYHYYEDGTFASQGLSPSRDTLESDPTTIEEYSALFDMYRAGYGNYSINEEEEILTYEYTANLRTHRVNQPTNVKIKVEGDSLYLYYEEMGVQMLLVK